MMNRAYDYRHLNNDNERSGPRIMRVAACFSVA